MRNRVVHKLSLNRTVLPAFAAIAALAGPIAMGIVTATAGGAQSTTTTQNSTEVRTAFEAVSLRLVDSNAGPARAMIWGWNPCLLFNARPIDHTHIAIGAPLYALISIAYGKPGSDCRLTDFLIGGPEWIKSDQYDIEATMPEGSPDYTHIQFTNGNAPALQMMLQTLLADRFKLKVHRDMRDISVYVLTAGASVKLTPQDDHDVGARTQRTLTRRLDQNGQPYGDLIVGKASMADLASMLGQVLGALVQDRTGLSGRFYVTLEFDNKGIARPTLAEALQQIGLKLEAKKGPMEVLVIDSVERPAQH